VPLALVIPAVAASLVALAYLVTRPLGGEPQPSFFVIGSSKPGLQLGQIAPGIQAGSAPLPMTDVDGAPVALTHLAGRPIWIIFWKTACEPCEAEAPDVAAAYAAHAADRLALLGIDVWDTSAAARDYLAAHPSKYPIAFATSGDLMEAYGIWGAPTHYFIGSDGIIRDRYFGPMTPAQIEASLARILPASSS